MKKILFFISSRAESSLLLKVFNLLDKCSTIDYKIVNINIEKDIEKNLDKIYRLAWDTLVKEKPDLVSCSFDRAEMTVCALSCFCLDIPFFQCMAGDRGSLSKDEMYRDLISTMATYKFCGTDKEKQNLIDIGITDNIYVSGYTHMDDFQEGNIEEIKLKYRFPNEFDLAVLHPDTMNKSNTKQDVKTLIRLLDKPTVILYPNKDMYREEIMKEYHKQTENPKVMLLKEFDNKNEYLTCLKYASRILGNSSSFAHELPYFNKQEIHIGLRNKYRKKDNIQYGGSKCIVKILEEILSKK